MSDYIADIPQIPPISSIADENTRRVLKALIDGWETRNGTTGDPSKAFVRVADVTSAINAQGRGYGTTDARNTKAAQELSRLMKAGYSDPEQRSASIQENRSTVTRNTSSSASRPTVASTSSQSIRLHHNTVVASGYMNGTKEKVVELPEIQLKKGDTVLLFGEALFLRQVASFPTRDVVVSASLVNGVLTTTTAKVADYNPDGQVVGLAILANDTPIRGHTLVPTGESQIMHRVFCTHSITADAKIKYALQQNVYGRGDYKFQGSEGVRPQLYAIIFPAVDD